MIALVFDNCCHTLGRIGQFVHSLGGHIYNSSADFRGGDYEYVFIEQGVKRDLTGLVDKFFFYDVEDDPAHFTGGAAFDAMQDRAIAYCKMVLRDSIQVSKLPQICAPIGQYANLAGLPAYARPQQQISATYFWGAPTFIGDYGNKNPDGLKVEDDPGGEIRFISKEGQSSVFSQRYQWLTQIDAAGIPAHKGIVFSREAGNQSLEWQSEYFGNVQKYAAGQIPYDQHIHNTLNFPILLCPTGYDRISFRTFDIIAAGGVPIMTDYGDRRMLYMPAFDIKVPDRGNAAEVVAGVFDNLPSLYRESMANREVLKDLTPEKVWKKFLSQIV